MRKGMSGQESHLHSHGAVKQQLGLVSGDCWSERGREWSWRAGKSQVKELVYSRPW